MMYDVKKRFSKKVEEKSFKRHSDCNNVRKKSKEKLTLCKEHKKELDKLQAVLGSHTLHSAHLAVNAMLKV